MFDPNASQRPTRGRVAWVIATLNAGGIGPVCRYAAEGVAQLAGWSCTIVSLHEPAGERTDSMTGVRYAQLGLKEGAARGFLRWLNVNPQDVVITSDVSYIESAFPYLPPETLHVIQIHDSLRRYRDVAVRNHTSVDGVLCVARHIEASVRRSLEVVGFHGLLDTVHNGAAYPPLPVRPAPSGPLRLLFLGRMDAIKGISDLLPILKHSTKIGVPVRLTIAGGRDEPLARRFKQKKLNHLVKWVGRVPHEECYRLASESDVFLMTSRKEPFGMVTIEAMSMGCVPIAYDIPSGSTEIIEHGRSGLLVPLGDYNEWAAAIQSLHLDRKNLAKLSVGAIERARCTFNSEMMAKNLAAFLSDVMAHAKSCPSKRQASMPGEMSASVFQRVPGYQRLPRGLRQWIRNKFYSHPRLGHWLLSR